MTQKLYFRNAAGGLTEVGVDNPLPVGAGEPVDLLSNDSATGDPVAVVGGSYIWNTTGTFGGATVKLQVLGPNGVTYVDVAGASTTSAAAIGVVIGSNATVKAVVTGGSPSALYSNLS